MALSTPTPVQAAGKAHSFQTNGKVMVKPGWLAVYGREVQEDDANLVAVAKGFGIPSERIAVDENPAEAIARMSDAAGPYMLEAMVDPNNYVYPIIPPGCSNVQMICGK